MRLAMPVIFRSPAARVPSEWLAPFGDVRTAADPATLGDTVHGVVLVATPAEAWTFLMRAPAGCAVVLWQASARQIDQALLHDVRVVAVLDGTSSREAVQTAIRSAVRLVAPDGEARAALQLARVLEIGRALASEKDLDTLLSLILTHARELTQSDGASIYTRDSSGVLFFRLWQNATLDVAPEIQKTPVGEDSVAGYVGRTGKLVVLPDAYTLPADAPYRFNPATDRRLGYRTRSLLTVPLTNKVGEVVGVLQLINRKDDLQAQLASLAHVERHVRAFDEQACALAEALAGQAGVALENSMLHADIERLFEGFIRASVQAIEARDPTTAGHSFRVADFTERLALAVDRADSATFRDTTFSKDQMRELRYAALLHDFGKVGVREQVLVKAKKLMPHQLEIVKQRFRYARAAIERRAYQALLALHERQLTQAEFLRERAGIKQVLSTDLAHLETHLETVLRANEPHVTHQEVSGSLGEAALFRFPGENGEHVALLDEFEFADLSLAKGSLNARERTEIESHVTHTYAFLSLIPWTKNLANLPHIAFAHHEKLDGSGYPRRLAATGIPVQSRMMTISDIYDALTAGDRPYKKGLPEQRALDILLAEARAGKIDSELLQVFVDCGAWRFGESTGTPSGS
jgi:HD-GYP domain-containing protein (c-di-GMP phosphodiesterase class II)